MPRTVLLSMPIGYIYYVCGRKSGEMEMENLEDSLT